MTDRTLNHLRTQLGLRARISAVGAALLSSLTTTAARTVLELGPLATVEDSDVLERNRLIEFAISGTETGSSTEVALLGPNGALLDGDGAMPVTTARKATSVSISLRHSSPGAGTWTATLHRIRAGVESSVATFSFSV